MLHVPLFPSLMRDLFISYTTQLEFRLDENTFQMYVRDIEKELNSEQNAYNKNENVEAIRRRHEVRY